MLAILKLLIDCKINHNRVNANYHIQRYFKAKIRMVLREHKFIIIAGFFEIISAYFMESYFDFTLRYSSVAFVIFIFISMSALTLVTQKLPLSFIYITWGAVGGIGAITGLSNIILHCFLMIEPSALKNLISMNFFIMGVLGIITAKKRLP